MKKALILGIDSYIGKNLYKRLSNQGYTVIGTTRRKNSENIYLDLLDSNTFNSIPDDIQIAFYCLGMTNLKTCRQSPLESYEINVNQTETLIKKLVGQGIFVVYPSTNMVFSGEYSHVGIDAERESKIEYGKQKKEIEDRLIKPGNSVLILRLSKVMDESFPLFHFWKKELLKKRVIYPFYNMFISPVSLTSVVDIMVQLANKRCSGIYQWSSNLDLSYEQIAKKLCTQLNVSQKLIVSTDATEMGILSYEAPLHTTMNTSKLCQELSIKESSSWDVINSIFSKL